MTDNPFVDADNMQPTPNQYWGQVMTDAQYVVLEKGAGRIAYQEGVHDRSQRRVLVTISVLPIPEMNLQYSVDRSLIANFNEWTKIVQPSIKALGVSFIDLNHKYARVELVPSGRNWKNSNDEVIELTTFKFKKVFDTVEEATMDFRQRYNSSDTDAETPSTPTETPSTPTETADTTTSDNERRIAERFLKVVVAECAMGQTNVEMIKKKVAANIPNYQIVSKYFTAESPETIDLIIDELAKSLAPG